MRFTRDRRGQSVVVGTVILFGFLILALASYQAFAVPAQNNQAEFEHSQDVQSDMEDLRASLLDVRDARQDPYQRPVRVSLGTRYNSRLFTVNPPRPEGSLTTQDRGNLSISGANVVNQDFDNTEPLFDREHRTRLLTYRPNYNEYRNPPRTTFEHSLLYNRFEGANRTVTGQRTIDGDDRQLSLVAYSNDIDRQGLSTTIDPETIDGPTPTIPIEGDDGTFTVTLPTHSPSVWTDLIGNTTDTGELNARVVDNTTQSVTVELEGEWNLQMARVGYEGRTVDKTPFSNVTGPDTATGSNQTGSSPAGQGGESVWTETDQTERVSTSGGLVSNIGSINAIVLSNPRVSPINPESGEISENSRFFRLSFTVGDPPGSGQRYVFVFPEDPDDSMFEIENGQITATDSVPISVFREDSTGVTKIIDEKEIRRDALNSWYQNQVDLNLLDEGAYTEPAEVRDDLAEIREYLFENSGQEAYITDVTGRTDLTLDTRRVIDVQDDIEAGDGEFSVTTRNLEGLDDGFVVVENRNSDESISFSSAEGDTTQIDADDVGGLEDGDEIVGILYTDDTQQTELSRDQEFVEDAPPAQFGQLDAESTTRGNSDNIRTVTFDWTSTGGVDTVTFETRTTDGGFVDGTSPTPPQEGSVSLNGANNNQLELSATIQGSGGSETCTVTIAGETTVTKQDFDCTAE